MKIQTIEDIIAWQKSKQLTIEIYKAFSTQKDYGFRDQIQRASVSIMNNIAEGFERNGSKEFSYFLRIAKGSCGEVRSMLCVAKELNYISSDEYIKLNSQSVEISKILGGFIKSL